MHTNALSPRAFTCHFILKIKNWGRCDLRWPLVFWSIRAAASYHRPEVCSVRSPRPIRVDGAHTPTNCSKVGWLPHPFPSDIASIRDRIASGCLRFAHLGQAMAPIAAYIIRDVDKCWIQNHLVICEGGDNVVVNLSR